MNAGTASVQRQTPLAVSAARSHLLDVIRVAELAASGDRVVVMTHVLLIDVGPLHIINVSARVHTPRVSGRWPTTSQHTMSLCAPARPSPRYGLRMSTGEQDRAPLTCGRSRGNSCSLASRRCAGNGGSRCLHLRCPPCASRRRGRQDMQARPRLRAMCTPVVCARRRTEHSHFCLLRGAALVGCFLLPLVCTP